MSNSSIISGPAPEVAPTVLESTTDDLASQRYLLDLALQPLDRFDGFVQIEQYLGSALRYQLNFICYALAMSQYTRTPAFSGYLTEAQANTIDKMRDKRVWSYWQHENLIGYQSTNPDPIVHHNVMYTGFYGAMLGLFETLNDARFSEPGALSLRWNANKVFPYEFASVAEAIRRNMEESKHVLYPCEPRLIYPMCNAFAISTLAMHDRLHRTPLTGDLVERMAASYVKNKYLRKDGRFISGRGPLRLVLGPATVNDATLAYWLHYTMPEQAAKSWQIVREKLVHLVDGKVEIEQTLWEGVDAGSYMRGDAVTRAAVAGAAREHGDDELAEAIEQSIEERFPSETLDGARRHRGVSVWANAYASLARFSRRDGMRDLMAGVVPDAWRTGPILSQAAYPDVLVAKAVTDGAKLELVLRPGGKAQRTRLALERLVPRRAYAVDGAATDTVTADADGRGLIDVDLGDRVEVTVRPIG